jgi:hypothetical protein
MPPKTKKKGGKIDDSEFKEKRARYSSSYDSESVDVNSILGSVVKIFATKTEPNFRSG